MCLLFNAYNLLFLFPDFSGWLPDYANYLIAFAVPIMAAMCSIATRKLNHLKPWPLMFWFAVFSVAIGGLGELVQSAYSIGDLHLKLSSKQRWRHLSAAINCRKRQRQLG